MLVVPLFLAGWFLWTIGEYVMHRVVMHALRGRGLPSKEHLIHHAVRDSILEKWALAWAGTLAAGYGIGVALHPAVGVGWVVGYGFYDLQHFLAHRRPPRTCYQRWLRRHHFHHHFGHPLANHGVTWPLWDRVFGTYERPEPRIRVPRRLAMVWLLDDDGDVRPEHAADYEVVGRATAAERTDVDRRDAFANRAPELV